MSLLEQVRSGRRHSPPRLLIYGTEGIGKAQPLDAHVLTPSGFRAMRDIAVGDAVIGADGEPHRVLATYLQGERDVFQVTFRDGSTTQCCDDHLWFTETRGERDRGIPGAVRTLEVIRKTLRYGTHFNHAVPRVRPVKFESGQQLPIAPWLLGMYLGDGCSSGGSVVITNPEPDIQRRIGESLLPGDTAVSDGRVALRIKTRRNSNSRSKLKQALVELGLDGVRSEAKFVPPAYLHASVQDRLALLRGLLDSDGHVANPGAVEFSTASPQLAEAFCFLVRSLGGSAKRTLKTTTFTHRGARRSGLPAHRIFASFPEDVVPVSSDKHLAKWETAKWAIRHTIRTVEPVGKKVCKCIKIDALDSLYVTDDFIVTHNSTTAAGAPAPIFIPTEDGLDQIDCASFPLARRYEEVVKALSALYAEKHEYQTVVVDSLDWLERLIWDEVCREYGVKSIEKADGGYAKGYTHALTQWREILSGLDALRNERGMCVILLAHAKVEKFEDPESVAYDRYSPRLHKHAAALVTEWTDAVLFATRKFRTESEDAGFNRTRSIAVALGAGGGERILRCVGGPSCIAKNRYSLPAEVPLSWAALMQALAGAPEPVTESEPEEN